MHHGDSHSSLNRCLRKLNSDVQHNRVSAKLYEELSKTLFLESGDTNLQILHKTHRETPHSIRDAPSASTSATEITKLESTNESRSGRQVTIAEEFKNLRNDSTGLRGYLIPQSGGSRTRLDVSKSVYDALCAHEGISSLLNDTIMYMGFRLHDSETVPPPPKWQHLTDSLDLQGWELSFMLKYAQLNESDKNWPWSVRQFALYSKYDTKSDACVSTFVAPPSEVLDEFREMLSDGNLSAVAAHTALNIKMVQITLAYWRPYVVWIANELSGISRQIAFSDPLRERLTNLAYDGIGERLGGFESIINDAAAALKANKNVVFTLRRMWLSCKVLDESSFESTYLDALMNDIHAGFDAHIQQLQNLQQKAKTYAQTVSNYRNLASGLLLQENGKSLESLARAARADSEATIELSKQAQEDAEAVKALTFVALVFLPTTTVLNFFSTSLYESSDNGFVLKPHWWLFLAIGIPMTILVLIAWKIYVSLKKKSNGFRYNWQRLSWTRADHRADKDAAGIELSSLSNHSV